MRVDGWRTIAAIALGAVVVGVVLVRTPALLALVALGVAWVITPADGKLLLVLASACLPFTLGDVGSVPDLLVIELLAPVAFLTALLSVLSDRAELFPGESLPMWAAVGVFVAVNALHVVFGALSGSTLQILGSGSTGLRAYYDLLIGPMVFGSVVWMSARAASGFPTRRVLRWMLWIASAAAVLRIASYYLVFEMPLLGGVFRYGVVSRIVTGGTADRIGGLAEAASLGLACLFAAWYAGEHGRWLILPGAVLSAATVLSGGRAFVLGVLISGSLLIVALSPRARVRAAALGALAAGLGGAVVAFTGLTSQFARLTALAGGLALQDPARYAAIGFQLQEFARSPVIGKGIGQTTVAVTEPFVAVQVAQGGHATYTSVLANQGAVGLLSFVYIAVSPAIRSFALLRGCDTHVADPRTGALVFVMIFAAIRSTMFLAGGNGYSDVTPYVYAAVFVATLAMARVGSKGEATDEA